ncbi:MAG: hypothetical protein E7369_02630 [Clostridiales bacterium]|nr:hypothetical protein [Clostridiales bacterium]
MKKGKWFTILKEKKPGLIVVSTIALFNVVFLSIFSLIVSLMNGMPYFEAMFNCLAMMFDPGCISGVVDGKGEAVLCIICFIIVIFGMVAFTGAVIGYVSNIISGFIEDANNGKNRLDLEEHVIILNWNDRGIEIINEYLLLDEKNVIVVFTSRDRELVLKQIEDAMSFTLKGKKIKNKPTIIVRTGNVFSTQQLYDISLEKAKTIIVLEEDLGEDHITDGGNGQTIKTLMQVSDIASKENSRLSQKVIVEVTSDWTDGVVNEILATKNNDRLDIVPVPVNKLFGDIFSQFSVMPKLNSVYSELFSNEGVEFHTAEVQACTEADMFYNYIETHSNAIPLTVRKNKDKSYAFYLASSKSDLTVSCKEKPTFYKMSLAKNFQVEGRHIIVLGHNKNLPNILEGLNRFNAEWKDEKDVIRVLLLDDKETLDKYDFDKKYSFVEECVAVDVHNKEFITNQLCRHFDSSNTTVLILSSETVDPAEKDLYALTNLVYLQSVLNKRESELAENNVEIVVEILDPEHHDIVQNYSESNVVISNKYVSKIMMQLSDKDAMYNFYKEILTYNNNGKEGKEIYVKKCKEYFTSIPQEMPVRDFIYSLYKSTNDAFGDGEVALGYIDENSNLTFFDGDLTKKNILLNDKCKLIVFSDH